MNDRPVWKVIMHRQPQKILRRLPKDLLKRICIRLDELKENPYPEGSRKYENLYRIRVGEWRVSYAVENDTLVVLVIEIAPRSGAYRNL
jgi:mRNA interferase RelE/StbE